MNIGGLKTWLKRGLQALRGPGDASEDRFRRLFEKLPEPVWILTDSHFVEANPAALAAIGYVDRPSFLHIHPADLSPEYQPDGELSRAKAERMNRLGLEKGLHRFDWVHKRRDGSLFPVEVTLTPMDWMGKPSSCCIWRDISERKRLEATLREKTDQLETIFEHATIGLALSENRIILRANQTLCDLFGYGAEELIGQTSARLFPTVAAYQQTGTRGDEASLRSGEVLVREMPMRHKDGQEIWVRVAAKVVDPKAPTLQIISMVEDITARRKTEERNRQLLGIIDDSSDLIAMATPDGQLTYINPQGLKMVGMPENTDPQTLWIHSFYSAPGYERISREIIPTLLENGQWQGEVNFLHQDGHEFPVSCSASAHRDGNGQTILFSNISRDISDEKQAQMALIAAKEAAEAAPGPRANFSLT